MTDHEARLRAMAAEQPCAILMAEEQPCVLSADEHAAIRWALERIAALESQLAESRAECERYRKHGCYPMPSMEGGQI